MATIVYPSLKAACLALVRIEQPLTTADILRHLRSLRQAGALGGLCSADVVPAVLSGLQDAGEIEYVGGVWMIPKKAKVS